MLLFALVITTLVIAMKVDRHSISFGVAVVVICLSAVVVTSIEEVIRTVLKRALSSRFTFALSVVAWASTSSVALAVCSLVQEQS